MAKKKTTEPKKRGTPSHIEIYNRIAAHSGDIVNNLFELTKSRNENIRLGALNTLIDKILPDLKATEMRGEGGGPILIKIVPESIVYGTGTDRTADQELPKTAVNL